MYLRPNPPLPWFPFQQDLTSSPPKSAPDGASGSSGYQRGVTEFHGSSHPTANLLAPLAPLLMPFRCGYGWGRQGIVCLGRENVCMCVCGKSAGSAGPASHAIQLRTWAWSYSVRLTAVPMSA